MICGNRADMVLRIVTFTTGRSDALRSRTIMALLSAKAWAPAGSTLHLVTDAADEYAWIAPQVELLTVTEAQLEEWKGRHRFFWRAKMEAVLHAAGDGQDDLLYIDSDTITQRSLQELADGLQTGDAFMHLHEVDLATNSRRGNRELWSMVKGRSVAGVTFSAPCPMWNAGVIAVGRQRLGDLRRALTMLDGLSVDQPPHFVAEQLCFSISLSTAGRLRPAEAWIDHYWGNKDGFDKLIHARLGRWLARGTPWDAAMQELRRDPIIAPVMVRRRRWQEAALRLIGLPNG
jgi:hypothetical protein